MRIYFVSYLFYSFKVKVKANTPIHILRQNVKRAPLLSCIFRIHKLVLLLKNHKSRN